MQETVVGACGGTGAVVIRLVNDDIANPALNSAVAGVILREKVGLNGNGTYFFRYDCFGWGKYFMPDKRTEKEKQ